MQQKMKKRLLASTLAIGLLAPSVCNTAMTFADANDNVPDGKNETQDPQATLKSVVRVNGNLLVKDQPVMAGDTVTWDIITRAGNTGVMKHFKDELPKGIKFNPNSKYAITVYKVNNDGTIGDEITTEGKLDINGKEATWTPKDPLKYFYTGEASDSNRLLFHITAVVENNVDPETVLVNNAKLTVVNPKNEKEQVVTDKAQVHTLKEITPTLLKHVSTDNGNKWLDKGVLATRDDEYIYRLLATIPVHAVESDFRISDPMENVQSYKEIHIYEGIYTNPDRHELEDAVTNNNKTDIATEVPPKSPEDKVDDTTINADKATQTEDTKEAKDVKTVRDVTDQFTIKTEANGQIVAVAKEAYVKKLGKAKEAQKISMVISGVKIKSEVTNKELERYSTGNVRYIPNTASMKTDKNKIDSNQTTVTPPKPNPKEGSIGKSVSIDEGQNWVNSAQLAGLDKYYDYKLDVSAPFQQEIQGLKIKDTFIAGQDIKHAKVRVMMNEPVKATSNTKEAKPTTNASGTSTEATATTDASTQTGETTTSTAPNTTVNVDKDTPEETTITLRRNTTTADASTQTGETSTSESKATSDASTQTGETEPAEDEKDTGIDVTSQGKISLEKDADGNTIFIWKAKDDFVHKINEANEKTGAIRLTVYIEGVTLRDATKEQLNELIKNKKLTVPNKAQLLVTNKERFTFTLDSNKVTVTLPSPEIPKDQGTQTDPEPTPEETHESTQPSKETEETTPTTSEEKEADKTTETTESTVEKDGEPTEETTTSTTEDAKTVVNNSEDNGKFDNKFDNKPLANTGEALKKHPILSALGAILVGGSIGGLVFWKTRKKEQN
ncbi:LPXTG cell wall anchor domain-containing protein [Enterococcus cecorum]|uniref:LPXTG cell wall anchor domain-containing protein n=1 Tax=Enterococcus cecorum TaxID=44008 RepID=UPI00148BE169|nr:LPXTG cell wall anchor domain-containing protein [Enterococcus cecorum]